jgi:hypothetical protein
MKSNWIDTHHITNAITERQSRRAQWRRDLWMTCLLLQIETYLTYSLAWRKP